MTMTPLVVDFAGELYEPDPDGVFVIGRSGDLEIDDNPYLHRRFIEIVGTYQPRLEPSGVIIDNEKALKWLRNGAQPTDTVARLLKISGAMDEFTASKATAS